MTSHCTRTKKEYGAVLSSSLMFMAILSLLSGTAFVLSRTDLHISRNHRSSAQAFNQANAGVYFTLASLESELGNSNSTFSLPANIGNNATLAFSPPSGFSFSISSIRKVSPREYAYQSTGTGPNNSQADIEVTFQRDSAINFAVFGDKKVDVGNTAGIYSYDSDVISNPSPSNSTGHGDTGSNISVILRNNCVVDGDVALGEDSAGTDASLTDQGGIVSGTNGLDIGRVDPDPLGVVGGEYADSFVTYSSTNDNANATDPFNAITNSTDGPELNLGNSENATLPGKSGGANYFFDEIRLSNNAYLYIDTSSGPVNIWLTGEIDAVTSSNFFNTTNNPKDFSIFANSQDNTDKISIGNDVTFAGLIYAPYITVRMDNSADIYGAIVAHESEVTNNVDIYFDTGLQNQYQSRDLTITSWRDDRVGS